MPKTTGWAILRYNEFWPWTGGIVYRTRRACIAAWENGYKPWKQCYRSGDRCVRVTVTESHPNNKGA